MTKINKIEPDNIKDSVVEIKYESELPFELVLGLIYNALSKDFKSTKSNTGNQTFKVPGGSDTSLELRIGKQEETILSDDEVSIKLLPNSIIFNCINGYILWPNYFEKIQKALTKIHQAKVVSSFIRVGLRYINQYVGMSIEDLVKFDFQFGIPEVESFKYNFRTEFIFEDYLVILSLIKNTASKIVGDGQKTALIPLSFIDIDVIKKDFNIDKLDELFEVIDRAHDIEKNLFFNKLLKAEYKKKIKIS